MVSMKLETFFLLAALLCLADAYDQTNYVIRNRETGLALEAHDRYLYMVPFNEDAPAPQRWKLEYVSPGVSVLTNAYYEKVLDVEFDVADNAKAIIYYKHKQANQRFYLNSDGSIVAVSENGLIQVALDLVEQEVVFRPYAHGYAPLQAFDFVPVDPKGYSLP